MVRDVSYLNFIPVAGWVRSPFFSTTVRVEAFTKKVMLSSKKAMERKPEEIVGASSYIS